MRLFTAVIERCVDTGLYVGYVPGLPGAHSPAETFDELHANLCQVIGMSIEDMAWMFVVMVLLLLTIGKPTLTKVANEPDASSCPRGAYHTPCVK